MKKKRKKLIRILILTLLLQIIPECAKIYNSDLTNFLPQDIVDFIEDVDTGEEVIVSAAQDYGSLFSTDQTIIDRINYACKNYGPGAYFSKNGKACTCHTKKINHVNSPSNCNCLRYVMINGSKVDMQAVQCFGYAMYMQMCILGTTQFKSSSSFSFIYGKGSNGNQAMTAAEMQRFFVEHASQIHPGTHMRCKYGSHSIVIMAIDYQNGKITYIDCNNKGTCEIRNFTTLTWAEFADRFYNINYIAVYKKYYSLYAGAPDPKLIAQIQGKLPTPTPTKRPATPTPSPSPADYPIGLYKVVASPHLNLREDTYTSSKKISILPNGMEVEIFDFAYNKGGHHWGLIDTEEGSGWSSMGYLVLVAEYTPTPTPTYAPADYESGTYTVTANSLMVREKQTTNSNSLGKITKYTTVDIKVFVIGEDNNNWGYISLDENNLQGWVSMDYMEIVPTAAPTPTTVPTFTPSPTPTAEIKLTPTPTMTMPAFTPTSPPTSGTPPEETPPEDKKAGISLPKLLICVLIICVAAEALLFVRIKKKRNKKWKKKYGKADFTKDSEEVKTGYNKK